MQKIQSFDWLHFKFKVQIQIFKLKTNLCLICRVLLQNVFLKLINHFCFLCFHSRWRFFWFHKDREITKNLFTLAENNFGERKLRCTRLNFKRVDLCIERRLLFILDVIYPWTRSESVVNLSTLHRTVFKWLLRSQDHSNHKRKLATTFSQPEAKPKWTPLLISMVNLICCLNQHHYFACFGANEKTD